MSSGIYGRFANGSDFTDYDDDKLIILKIKSMFDFRIIHCMQNSFENLITLQRFNHFDDAWLRSKQRGI